MRSQSLETDIAYLKDMVLYLDKADAVLYKARRYNLPLDDDMVVDSIAMNLGTGRRTVIVRQIIRGSKTEVFR